MRKVQIESVKSIVHFDLESKEGLEDLSATRPLALKRVYAFHVKDARRATEVYVVQRRR